MENDERKADKSVNKKRLLSMFMAAVLCGVLPAGCARTEVKQLKKISSETSAVGTEENSSGASADLSVVRTDIGRISVPEEVQVVGLGEASHGVKEYHLMKGEVFKALVENNGCRAFVIEGDFGGALKVEEYIHGGSGTAREAVREIGFAIYDTQELVDLVEWMRTYNDEIMAKADDTSAIRTATAESDGEAGGQAAEDGTLHFYGMDMQRVDNNKEYLFELLDRSVPALGETYKAALEGLTDESRMEPDTETFQKAGEDLEKLLEEMDAAENEIVSAAGQPAFDRARECANTLRECAKLSLCADSDYNTMRDQFMFEKVLWLTGHQDGMLFINGHNGHIGRTSVSGYTCLGELLADSLGDKYFAIGTDAEDTVFQSQDAEGNFSVMEVSNRNLLNRQLDGMDGDFYYVDFAEAAEAEGWKEIAGEKQKITTLNVGLSEEMLRSPLYYTASLVPGDTFDGMIVFRKVLPTTLLGEDGEAE